MQRRLERECNETLRYLKNRLKELQDWKAAGLPESQNSADNLTYHALAKSFYSWFGYPYNPAMTIYPAYSANKPTDMLSLPVVTTLQGAVDKVIGITERSIDAFEKQIDATNMRHGFNAKSFTGAGAYVYTDDDLKNIHLCKGHIYEPEKIDNNTRLIEIKTTVTPEEEKVVGGSTIRLGSITSTSYHDTKALMAHECSHFHDIGLLGVGSEKRGLYDLYVMDTSLNKKYGPYVDDGCNHMGKVNSYAMLCNADNYTNFIVGTVRYDDDDTYNYF